MAKSDPSAAKSIVLIGLMGAGKTTIGRKLADRMELPFVDSDDEVERAAGCSIADIFEIYGEPAFRDVEARVIQRIMEQGPAVVATGGGAFMNERTRDVIRAGGIAVWLKAELDVLVARTSSRTDRPLLKDQNPREKLHALIEERYPVYALADITVETGNESTEQTAKRVYAALEGENT